MSIIVKRNIVGKLLERLISIDQKTGDFVYGYKIISLEDISIPIGCVSKIPYKKNENYIGEKINDPIILKDYQIKIYNQCVYTIVNTNSLLMELFTGFGKTILCIKLLIFIYNNIIRCTIKNKILIIVNISSVKAQWETQVKKYCKDIIHNIHITTYMGVKNYKDLNEVGLLICDEIHIATKMLIKVLLTIHPYISIGATATPEREDNLNVFFNLFFKNSIVHNIDPNVTLNIFLYYPRILVEEKIVNRSLLFGGGHKKHRRAIDVVDWTSLVSSVETNNKRIKKIAELVFYIYNLKKEQCPDLKFLLVAKRIETLHNLKIEIDNLIEEDITYIFTGSDKKIDPKKRIILSTDKKSSVGLDDTFNWIFYTCGEKNIMQLIGRIRYKVKNIVDIVDENKLFKIHFNKRLETYEKFTNNIKVIKFKKD